jgi:hypothetical protein
MSPTLTAYAAGQLFYFVAGGANTGAVTLNVDGLGAKAITRDGSTALAAGDINSGEIVVVIYDGTRFQMINAANSFGNTTINGTLTVTGNTGLQANVSVTSALSVGGTFAVTGAATLGSTLAVTGKSDLPTVSTASANAAVAVITDLSAAGASITSANVGTAVITTGTVTNLTATSASVASVNAGVALLTTATVTNLTATGASIASANLGNAVISALTLTGVSVASANVGVANITDLRAVGASVTSANLGTAVVTNGTVTNLTATSASVASVNAAVALLTTATVTTLTASGASIASANIGNLQFTAASIASINAGVAVINNLTATSASIASANVGTAVITTGTVTNLTSTAASVASANVGVALITTGTVTSLTATGASVASANVGTAVVTGLTVTNASVASLNAGTATITTGNLTFSSTAQRITGDFSNATLQNQLMLQSSTTNGNTRVSAIPNGTGTVSRFVTYNTATPDTSNSNLSIGVTGTLAEIVAGNGGAGSYLPMTFYTGGSERFRIETDGDIGIGTSTLIGGIRLTVLGGGTQLSPGTAAQEGLRIQRATGYATLTGINNDNNAYNGLQLFTGASAAVTVDTSGNVGIGVTPSAWASGNRFIDINNSASFGAFGGTDSMMLANAFWNGSNWVRKVANNAFRMVMESTSGTPSWTFQYAANSTAGSTISWSEAMRIDSSGNVGIGGTAGADTRVQVLGTAPSSGGQSRGYLTTQTIPSSTTINFIGFGSVPATQAASFTCSQIYHYYAAQGSLGAGSAVTTQYGYFADSTLTGATNNYGFYSNIASGSNRWNFYAAGTANNYFAGRVGIGVTPTYALHVESAATEASRSFRLAYDSTYYLDIIQKGAAGAFFRSNSGEFVFNVTGTDYARLTTAGEFITGGTTDQGAYNLQCNGTGVWGAGAYVNGSDARLKDDITTLNDGLNVVSQLRPVTFKYKPDYSKDQNVQTGFIAQELQAVLAGKDYVDGVVQAGPNHLNVAYQSLIPILVKAIQELAARVAELEAK